ncbi:hypothetical protein G7Y79_00039g076070 [Physcia stellaris]|nr:hypothetical protein G7Y79_00039g076070 [Physcia stellaris]
MSPTKLFISLAALLITTTSAIPTQIHERAKACAPGSFRMKYYYENSNGQMAWNGLYAKDLGGPLGSTKSKDDASVSAFSVDSDGSLFHPYSGYVGCLTTEPYYPDDQAEATQPANMTVFIDKGYCGNGRSPKVECIKTPQYNMCWAGQNKVIQQCGQFVVFSPDRIPSAGGASCGPPLFFFIDNC